MYMHTQSNVTVRQHNKGITRESNVIPERASEYHWMSARLQSPASWHVPCFLHDFNCAVSPYADIIGYKVRAIS
jgi:hypothetical protein